MIMLPRLTTTTLLSACVSLSLPSAFATNKHPQDAKQYLFILSAKSGVLYQSGQTTYLKLNKVDPHTLWFTDRPNRLSGTLPTATLIKRWHIGFKQVPPNAGLIHTDITYNKHGFQQPLAIEISQPTMQHDQITFKVSTLSGDTQITLNGQKKLRHPKLFIDPPAARLIDFHQMPM